MNRRLAGLAALAFLACSFAPQIATAQHSCAPPASTINDDKDSSFIHFWFTNSVPANLASLIRYQAAPVWNDDQCNEGGNDFPIIEKSEVWFETGGYEASVDAYKIKIYYDTTVIPTTGKCADTVGWQITFFEKTKSGSFTQTCPVAKYLADLNNDNKKKLAIVTIVHEFGHMLGAGHSSCTDDVMYGVISTDPTDPDKDRVITHDTCRAVDEFNNTNEEFLAECALVADCTTGPGDPGGVVLNGPNGGPPDIGGRGGPGADFDQIHYSEQHFVCTDTVVGGVYTEICFVFYS